MSEEYDIFISNENIKSPKDLCIRTQRYLSEYEIYLETYENCQSPKPFLTDDMCREIIVTSINEGKIESFYDNVFDTIDIYIGPFEFIGKEYQIEISLKKITKENSKENYDQLVCQMDKLNYLIENIGYFRVECQIDCEKWKDVLVNEKEEDNKFYRDMKAYIGENRVIEKTIQVDKQKFNYDYEKAGKKYKLLLNFESPNHVVSHEKDMYYYETSYSISYDEDKNIKQNRNKYALMFVEKYIRNNYETFIDRKVRVTLFREQFNDRQRLLKIRIEVHNKKENSRVLYQNFDKERLYFADINIETKTEFIDSKQ